MAKKNTVTSSAGGETHQTTDADHPVLTTNHGMPISDNQNQLKAGSRGPVLLEDEVYREKINHFDHERIPERIVHARGTGAQAASCHVLRSGLVIPASSTKRISIRSSDDNGRTSTSSTIGGDLAPKVERARRLVEQLGESRLHPHHQKVRRTASWKRPRRDTAGARDASGEGANVGFPVPISLRRRLGE